MVVIQDIPKEDNNQNRNKKFNFTEDLQKIFIYIFIFLSGIWYFGFSNPEVFFILILNLNRLFQWQFGLF